MDILANKLLSKKLKNVRIKSNKLKRNVYEDTRQQRYVSSFKINHQGDPDEDIQLIMESL